ncbi:hypothetical protein ACSQ67_018084 [Phaseolus vulgaris]
MRHRQHSHISNIVWRRRAFKHCDDEEHSSIATMESIQALCPTVFLIRLKALCGGLGLWRNKPRGHAFGVGEPSFLLPQRVVPRSTCKFSRFVSILIFFIRVRSHGFRFAFLNHFNHISNVSNQGTSRNSLGYPCSLRRLSILLGLGHIRLSAFQNHHISTVAIKVSCIRATKCTPHVSVRLSVSGIMVTPALANSEMIFLIALSN